MRVSLLALALLTVPLVGCATPTGPAPPAGSIAFETLAQGDNSGIEERGTVTVRTQAAWEALWANHTANQGDGEPRPSVDFSERMVLAAFHGQGNNGCYGTEVTNVTGQPNGSIVVTGEHYVIQGQACTEQITYPFHIVSIPLYSGDVVFQLEETTRQAGDGGDGGDDGDGGGGDEETPAGQESTYTCRKQSSGDSVPSDGADVSFDSIDQGSNSGIEEVCLTTARNETAWKHLWSVHTNRTTDPRPRPDVNFSERMVVAIFKGESPDGCHGAEIENLTANGSTLHVDGAFFKVEGAFCTQQITYPFHMVETDRYEEVRFDVDNETRQA